MDNSKKTFVLVHGAWHGAWSYKKTKKFLEQTGANVVSFDLPGHGDDKTQIKDVTQDSYVKKVKRELQKIQSPVILVGHSLAGFIISQVAEEMPEKIEKLIFIASMVPYEQRTVFDIISADEGSELLRNLIFAEDKSWATVSEETLKTVVYNGATQQQIIEAAPNLVRQATQPFFVTVGTTKNAFGKIDKVYIICEKDKILSANAQRLLIDKIGIPKSISLNTGHVPHVENPEQLAKAILEA